MSSPVAERRITCIRPTHGGCLIDFINAIIAYQSILRWNELNARNAFGTHVIGYPALKRRLDHRNEYRRYLEDNIITDRGHRQDGLSWLSHMATYEPR